MNKVLLALLLLGKYSLCTAQDASFTIDANKNTNIESLELNDGILVSVKPLYSSATLYYIGNDAQKKWEIELEKSNFVDKQFLIKSATNNTIYNVNIPVGGLARKDHTITKIGKDGSKKVFSIKFDENVGRNLQAAFCDDNNFYYLTTDNGDERNDKRKTSEILILNKFDGNTFSHKRIELKLPAVPAGENSTFWSYIGQTQSGKHVLTSKVVDTETNLNKISIVLFDNEGTILEKNNFDFKLTGKYTRPSLAFNNSFIGFQPVEDMDEKIVTKSSGGMAYTFTDPTYGGFVHIKLDPYSESIYIFGLYGPDKFMRVAANYDGLYIYRYSLNGTLLWKVQENASKDLLTEKTFKVHGMPRDRYLSLAYDTDKNIHLALDFSAKRFDYEISQEGKLNKIYKSVPSKNYNLFYVKNVALEKYMNLLKKADYSTFYPSVHATGVSLLEIRNDHEVVVTYFKK